MDELQHLGTSELMASSLSGSPVRLASGAVAGRVKDVVIRVERDLVVAGLVLRSPDGAGPFVRADLIQSLKKEDVRLSAVELDPRPFERRDGELLLLKDLKDKEIVHVRGRRVTRANDMLLRKLEDRWIVAGIDVSTAALLHQIGLGRLVAGRWKREVIPWNEVEMFESDVPVPVSFNHDKIARLHPADIAELMQSLGRKERSEILEDLPDEIAADVLEDLSPEDQADLLVRLDRERAADILEEMVPDAAADVLNDIREEDPEAAAELVSSMETADAEAVQRLQAYEDDSAGGIMTSSFASIPASVTVADALGILRRISVEVEHLDPIVVLESEGGSKVAGMASLQDLLLAEPTAPLSSLVRPDAPTAVVTDSAQEAVRMIAHYELAALPVLDDREQLVGIVTRADALDLMVPREWSARSGIFGGKSLS